jgi:hypothetical protein
VVVLTEQDKKLGKEWWENAKRFFPEHIKIIDEKLKEFEMYEAVQELKKVISEEVS